MVFDEPHSTSERFQTPGLKRTLVNVEDIHELSLFTDIISWEQVVDCFDLGQWNSSQQILLI